jgi:hypothetical protein
LRALRRTTQDAPDATPGENASRRRVLSINLACIIRLYRLKG